MKSNKVLLSLSLVFGMALVGCGGPDVAESQEASAAAAKSRARGVPTGVEAAPRELASEVTYVVPPSAESLTCWCATGDATGCILELNQCEGGCLCGISGGTLEPF